MQMFEEEELDSQQQAKSNDEPSIQRKDAETLVNELKMAHKKQTPEEAFFENLTMGLKNTLSNVPRICDIKCEMRQPCEKAQVLNWEQRHSVYLPEDMKKFYLSTDGFVFQWSYQYAPNDIRRVGYIHFPHLLQITLLRENVDTTVPASSSAAMPSTSAACSTSGYNSLVAPHTSTGLLTTLNLDAGSAHTNQGPSSTSQSAYNTTSASSTTSAASARDLWGNPTPIITSKTKIFELNNINDVAKVCLIYESTGTSNPKLYLLELNDFKWQFLTDTFSEYLRMSIAHLGLPFWELCFSNFGLPSWAEQLFLLLAPHLLEEHEPRRSRIINPGPEHPYNTLDLNIFRVKPKGASKSNPTSKHK